MKINSINSISDNSYKIQNNSDRNSFGRTMISAPKTPLSQEQKELFDKWVPLVYHIFRSMGVTSKGNADDLLQAGLVGLWKAVKCYIEERGSFLNYAIPSISRAIKSGIIDAQDMTRGKYKLKTEVSEAIKEAQACGFAIPNKKELAKRLNLTERQVAMGLNLNKYDINTETMRNEILANIQMPRTAIQEFAAEEERQKREFLVSLIFGEKSLTGRQKEILTKHFGLNGEPPLTLEQIGKEKGLSRQRIDQLEKDAFKKIKRNKLIKEAFEDYMEFMS